MEKNVSTQISGRPIRLISLERCVKVWVRHISILCDCCQNRFCDFRYSLNLPQNLALRLKSNLFSVNDIKKN